VKVLHCVKMCYLVFKASNINQQQVMLFETSLERRGKFSGTIGNTQKAGMLFRTLLT